MTMPDERLRALRWGVELLEQVISDAELPSTVTAVAKQILPGYPTSRALDDWLLSDAAGLLPEWTVAFSQALELFEQMRVDALGSAGFRRGLMYTLRHFPDRLIILEMVEPAKLGEWLGRPSDPQTPRV